MEEPAGAQGGDGFSGVRCNCIPVPVQIRLLVRLQHFQSLLSTVGTKVERSGGGVGLNECGSTWMPT